MVDPVKNILFLRIQGLGGLGHLSKITADVFFAKTITPKCLSELSDQLAPLSRRLTPIEVKRLWIQAVDKIRFIIEGKKIINKAGFIGVTLTPPYWQENFLPGHPSKHFIGYRGYEDAFEDWKSDQLTKLSFEAWIQERNLSFPSVRYFQEDDRKEYAVVIKEGKLIRQNGEPLFTAEDLFIFVIGPDQVMYVYEGKLENLHHSSAFSGGAIISGGMIKTDKEGNITELSNKSGHYEPSRQNLLDTLQILTKRGVDLSGVALLEVNKEDSISFFYFSAQLFLQTKGTCKKDGYLRV